MRSEGPQQRGPVVHDEDTEVTGGGPGGAGRPGGADMHAVTGNSGFTQADPAAETGMGSPPLGAVGATMPPAAPVGAPRQDSAGMANASPMHPAYAGASATSVGGVGTGPIMQPNGTAPVAGAHPPMNADMTPARATDAVIPGQPEPMGGHPVGSPYPARQGAPSALQATPDASQGPRDPAGMAPADGAWPEDRDSDAPGSVGPEPTTMEGTVAPPEGTSENAPSWRGHASLHAGTSDGTNGRSEEPGRSKSASAANTAPEAAARSAATPEVTAAMGDTATAAHGPQATGERRVGNEADDAGQVPRVGADAFRALLARLQGDTEDEGESASDADIRGDDAAGEQATISPEPTEAEPDGHSGEDGGEWEPHVAMDGGEHTAIVTPAPHSAHRGTEEPPAPETDNPAIRPSATVEAVDAASIDTENGAPQATGMAVLPAPSPIDGIADDAAGGDPGAADATTDDLGRDRPSSPAVAEAVSDLSPGVTEGMPPMPSRPPLQPPTPDEDRVIGDETQAAMARLTSPETIPDATFSPAPAVDDVAPAMPAFETTATEAGAQMDAAMSDADAVGGAAMPVEPAVSGEEAPGQTIDALLSSTLAGGTAPDIAVDSAARDVAENAFLDAGVNDLDGAPAEATAWTPPAEGGGSPVSETAAMTETAAPVDEATPVAAERAVEEIAEANEATDVAPVASTTVARTVEELLAVMALPDSRAQPSERALATDALVQMLPEASPELVELVARRMCLMDRPPEALAEAVLALVEGDVRRAVLEDARLSTRRLVHLATTAPAADLRIVARRRRLPPMVCVALIERGDETTLLELVRNQHARLDETAFHHLAELARQIVDLQAPLATRPDLPPAVGFLLFRSVPPRLRRHLVSRFLTDSRVLEQVFTLILRDPPPATADQVTRVESMIDSIAAGDVDTAVRLLSKLLVIDERTARWIVSDRWGEPLVVALKVLGYARSTFPRAMGRIIASPAGPVDGGREMDELQALFDSLSYNKARLMLLYWDWAARGTGPYGLWMSDATALETEEAPVAKSPAEETAQATSEDTPQEA